MGNDLLSWESGHSISLRGFATSVFDAFGLSAEHTVQTQVDSLNWELFHSAKIANHSGDPVSSSVVRAAILSIHSGR